MTLSASNMSTNIVVTVLVAVFVVFLPYFDRRICKKLGINIRRSISGNTRESRLLVMRKIILFIIFAIYLSANMYLVFFSRLASADYLIHVAPFNDLFKSVKIDSGVLGLLTEIYTQGLSEGISHIHVEKVDDITQVYMNIMLYVPMGYMLPYISDWCRARVKIRPVLCCFLVSFLTENLQLIFKRGFYDIDDLLSNTLGGLLGQALYISLAYVVTHPDWRKELRRQRKWRRKARKRTLYPFANKIGISRATIVAGGEDIVNDFYINRLGFRSVEEFTPPCSESKSHLLQMGSFQLEVICPNDGVPIGDQYLTLSVKNIARVKKRLNKNGFETGDFDNDPYTGLRTLSITGPEGIRIKFIEA